MSKKLEHRTLNKGSNENHLTNREMQVLELLSKGSTNKIIAQELFISTNTVKTHIRNIYEKLNVKNRAGVVSKAFSLKYIQ